MLIQVNSEDESDDVYHGTGCRNVSHCQQRYYDHPDDHSQPTFEKLLRLDFEVTPGFKPSLDCRSLLGKPANSSTGDIIKTVAVCSLLFGAGFSFLMFSC